MTKRKRDHKQVFDFGDPTVPRLDSLNRWPDELDGFRDTMVELHASMGPVRRPDHHRSRVITLLLQDDTGGVQQQRFIGSFP